MIKGIGLQNFRSFVDKTFIELKPITVFVGKNSSGKSSLLRTFPLLRQSVEENTTGPILWYGRFVDYGDFTDVLSRNSENKEITFSFSLSVPSDLLQRYAYYRFNDQEKQSSNINTELTVYSKDKKTKTKNIKLILEDGVVNIALDDNNNVKLQIESKGRILERDGIVARNLGQFIPSLSVKGKEEATTTSPPFFTLRHSRGDRALEVSFIDAAAKSIHHYFHINSDITQIPEAFKKIGFISKSYARSLLKFLFREQKVFSKNLKQHGTEIMDDLYPYIMGWNINNIIDIVNTSLADSFRNVKYIAPLRATSERFYRFQDLQVNEIDHTGSNLAMLLNSLRPADKAKFEEWTKLNFDFVIKVEQSGSHFAILINTGDNSENYNISDMGFGYSQVLPIVAAIWLETERRIASPRRPITFIIEQPELHLHPSYQHNLATIFAKVVTKAKENNIDLKIIFETHSQTMIEALGECIEGEVGLSENDVSILVFEKNAKQQTIVKKTYFNEDGYLQNWPVGFFSGR
ncbi:AAA family ATPase [Enterobacter asburiae]|uniref:AAA family ATPase n=1 Tax=Enterobacter asburiae TaxID=61645 RepID=UPI00301DB64F